MNDLHDMAVLYVVDALEPDEKAEFARHLADCEACQQEVRDMRAVTAELSRAVEATPPPSLRAAILAQIAKTPQEAPAGLRVATPSTAGHSDVKERSEVQERSNVTALRPRRLSRIPYLVAAAAVLVAVGFGGWALQSHDAVTEANSHYNEIAQLLATPDVRTVSGTLPGGGTGTVVLSRAQARAVFVADAMPDLADGKVYELWTVAGAPAPAGTFSASDAPAVVDLPAAALSAQRIVITVESSGGSQHPTSAPVMSVDVPRSA